MAIGFQASAVGSKTTTTGTTFTIALSSTAGDLVLVAIALASTTGSVSSITDGGGNTYHRVGSLASGQGTVKTELWKTDAVNPAASGTLTVTVNTTGFRASGVAASYRGVAFAGNPAQTNSNNTSPITTGALSLSETNSCIVTAGGTAANNAFTAQNGNLRNQTGTTSLRAVLIDSSGNGSPITDSATMTASAWVTVSVELRLLEVTQLENLNNWLDGLNPLWLQLSDDNSSNWADAFAFSLDVAGALTLQLSDQITTWSDAFKYEAPIDPLVTDQLSMSDGIAIGIGIQLAEQIFLQDVSGYGYEPYGQAPFGGFLQNGEFLGYGNLVNEQLTLSDQVSVGLAIALVVSDSLTMSDKVVVGYGNQITDQLTLSEALLLGYGDLISEQLAMVDAFASSGSSTLQEALSDSLTMADSLLLGYGDLIADSLTLVDKLVTGYGMLVADTESLSDVLTTGYGAGIADQLILSEALRIGYGDLIAEQMTLTDAFAAIGPGTTQLTLQLSDQLLMQDVSGYGTMPFGGGPFGGFLQNGEFLGYGDLIAEQMTLSDKLVIGFGLPLADQLPAMADQFTTSIGLQFFESFLYEQKLASDDFNRADENPLNPANWSAVAGLNPLQLISGRCLSTAVAPPKSGELYTGISWPNDQYAEIMLERSFAFSGFDLILRSDATEQNCYDFGFTDNEDGTCDLTISVVVGGGSTLLWENKRVSFIFGDLFRAEARGTRLSFYKNNILIGWVADGSIASGKAGVNLTANVLTTNVQLSSFAGGQAVGMADQPVVTYGLLLSDALTLADNVQLFAGLSGQLSLSDTMGTMTDSFAIFIDSLSFADQMTMTDQAVVVINGLTIAEQLTLTDKVAVAIVGLVISDQMTMTDQMGFSVGGTALAESLSDQMVMADAVDMILYITTIGDTLVFSDNLAIGYGNIISESLTLVDAFSKSLLAVLTKVLSDQLTMADAFAFSLTGTQFSEPLSDQLAFVDVLTLGYGDALTDQLVLVDSLVPVISLEKPQADQLVLSDGVLVGYGLTITDQLTMADAVATTSPVVAEQLSDQLVLAEALGLGYGNVVSDQLALLDRIDFLFPLGVAVTDQLVLTDSLAIGRGNALADSLTMADALTRIAYGYLIAEQLTLSDNISLQLLGALISLFPSDSLTMADGLVLSIGLQPADQLLLVDQLAVGYGIRVADQMVLSDQVVYSYILFQSPSDSLSMSDSLSKLLGILLATSDQLVLAEAVTIGYGSQIVDQMTMAEAAVLGLGLTVADNIGGQTDGVGAGYGVSVGDQMAAQTDQFKLVYDLLVQVQDATPQQLDALNSLMTYALQVQDALLLQEQLILMHGLLTGDSFSLADQLDEQLVHPLVLALTDTAVADWLDAILTTIVFAPSSIVLKTLEVLPQLIISSAGVAPESTASSLTVTKAEV